MEAIRSSETSGYILSTQRHIPEDGILRKTNLKPKPRTQFVKICCLSDMSLVFTVIIDQQASEILVK
jgi:hypothetical protein